MCYGRHISCQLGCLKRKSGLTSHWLGLSVFGPSYQPKKDACRRPKVWIANVEARQIREVREKAVSQQWWRPKCSSTPRDRGRSALDHITCTTCERRELLEWRCFVRTNCLISACYPNRNWLVKVQWRVLRSIMEPHHMLASPDLSFSSSFYFA